MKVLITGGAGYIGNELIKSLPKEFELVVIDNFHIDTDHKRHHNSELQKTCKLTLIEANISEVDKYSHHLSGVDVVVHLASLNSYKESNTNPLHYLTENNYHLQILLSALKQFSPHIQKMLVTSSRGVYGEGPYTCLDCKRRVYPGLSEILSCPLCGKKRLKPEKITESDTPNPTSYYGLTKHLQEDLVHMYCLQSGIPLDIIRIFNAYGENQGKYYSHIGIIPQIYTQIKNQGEMFLSGKGTLARDFVYIGDIVKVLSASITSLNRHTTPTEIYNLGSGQSVTISDLADYFTRLGYQFNRKYLPEFNDIKYSVADNTKVSQAFNIPQFHSMLEFLTVNYTPIT